MRYDPLKPDKKICQNCEYYDVHFGDCYNSSAPRFNPPPDFTCNQFHKITSEEDLE